MLVKRMILESSATSVSSESCAFQWKKNPSGFFSMSIWALPVGP